MTIETNKISKQVVSSATITLHFHFAEEIEAFKKLLHIGKRHVELITPTQQTIVLGNILNTITTNLKESDL